MKKEEEKFEDRYGSKDFEQGKGANIQKLIDRKEQMQMKKYGIKPTDTSIDVANLVARDVLNKVISEEEKAEMKIDDEEEKTEDEENKEKDPFDHKKEMRIKMMQYLNPRIVKSKEMKDYMQRSNVQEEIIARLNELATEKLDLYKKALAINAPVELNERIKENKEKKDVVTRQIGAHAYIKGVRQNIQSAKLGGRDVMRDPKLSSEKIASLYRKLPNITNAKDLRQQHLELHEEIEELDEAKKINRNVIRQGRTKIIKARVRGGKVQRRKRFSAIKGYTIRGGKLKRMSMAERLRRKRGQRRGKIKRKAKMARALMRRKRSLRRRASLGLKE